MRRWIKEGRVNSSSLVWREGWSDWRKADEVFSELSVEVDEKPASNTTTETPEFSTETPSSSSSANRYDHRRRESRGKAIVAIVGLGVLSLVLGGFLIWLVMKSS